MTVSAWIRVGWGFMAVTGLLAVIAAAMVFASITDDALVVQPLLPQRSTPQVIHLGRFLAGVTAAVLAGAAFFAGLACFFWGATCRRRELLEELLRRLPDQAVGRA
ncbi:hypothetical protein [Actinomadura gamaensis]|uniref:Uncharacterized protein n=1 Tax=Actinomadura gamaensis TaxID=1763541 RepID=A0ABV9U027_9ACTN